MSKDFEGLLQVYTGDGKGKTTAALGLAIRAIGRDMRVFIGQFMKHGDYGEIHSLKRFEENLTIEQFGNEGFHIDEEPSEDDIKRAKEGYRKIKEKLTSKKYQIVIADEICVAYHFDLLELDDLLNLISARPSNVELVFTGRNAPEEIIEKADLVSEMKEVKHPFQQDIEAREGIEY